MAIEIDFGSAEGKPALLGLSSPEYLGVAKDVLKALGYKPYEAAHHDDFLNNYVHVQYELVIIEEKFLCDLPVDNRALTTLQQMPMSRRRHSVIFLLGENFATLNTLHALQHSVNAVVHKDDIDSLGALIMQQVAETNLFLRTYRDTQLGIAQGRL
ncbi:MAG: hypothetical protein HY301_15690 [Verrucomicrobia bacterium]|nr:hypothetical protein [Verrucomicrobiota bacterium]